jgi:hypothetical protein
MVLKITKWLLCLGIGICSAQSESLESIARSLIEPKPPINFKASKRSDFPLYDKVFAEAYMNVGSRDPKWNADALMALRLWTYEQSNGNSVLAGPEFYTMVDALRRAITNGCDDPLVLYETARIDEVRTMVHEGDYDLLKEKPHATYARIMEGLKSHPYPAIDQIIIHIRGVQDSMSYSAGDVIPTLVEHRSNWLDHAINLAAEVDFSHTAPSQYYENMELLVSVLWIGGDIKKHYDQLEAALEKNNTCTKPIFLTIKGLFYSEWAWKARGSGYADSVTDDRWKLFHERLGIAQQCFEQAWALDPSNEYICKQLVMVSGGQCDMAALEKWFQRGKKINPDDQMLYLDKLNYLQPRWSGSGESMLQFGRECLNEGRWESEVPFVLLSAHCMLAGDSLDEKRAYFAQPEVWKEIEPLFKTYLARYPTDYTKRSSYANYAAWAGRWDVVAHLMRELGTNENPSTWEDFTLTPKLLKILDSIRAPANPQK